jgi:hypothetical protein
MDMLAYPAFYLWFFLSLAEWINGVFLMHRVARGKRGPVIIGSGQVLILLGLAASALWAVLLLPSAGLSTEWRSSPFPWLVSGFPIVLGMIALIACRTRPSKSASSEL